MSETKDPEEKAANAGRKTMTLNLKRTVEQDGASELQPWPLEVGFS